MPIVAMRTFNIQVEKDRTIILDSLRECGCLKADTIAERTGKSLQEVKNTLSALVSDGRIHCDEKQEICCADKKRLESFVNKLKNLSR